jgi:hypothetical protein
MPLTPDLAAFQNSLAKLPLVTYQPRETVIVDVRRPGRLLILKKGTVAIVKEDTEIAQVAEPGRCVWRTLGLARSAAHVKHRDRIASVLAHRLDAANHALIQLKTQLQTGAPHNVVAKTISKIEGLLAVGSASLVYAGYPYDPH